MLHQLADYTYTYTTTTSDHTTGLLAVLASLWIVVLIVAIVVIVGMWKTFQKAGKPAWGAIVPIYNSWLLAEVAGKPGWWGLLVFVAVVPFVGWIAATVISLIIALGVAKNFGKDGVFGVIGLWLFSPIGYCILGFGNAQYKGEGTVAPQSGAPVAPAAPAGRPVPPAAPTDSTTPDQSDSESE